MSVRSDKRNESVIQYLDTARELRVHTIENAPKFPKRVTFYISTNLANLSAEIYKHVATAQNIYLKYPEDFPVRRRELQLAYGKLCALDCEVGIAKDYYDKLNAKTREECKISDYAWLHWGELIFKEKNLIRKVLESDESRAGTSKKKEVPDGE